ncbi:MAG: AbrB/MazE/SpoVT family DNA-binding domain-containing protein [Luteolibacter sp.]
MPYFFSVTVTITSKGQITIPISLRQKFHLNVGDKLEFDEDATVLTARRAVNRDEWRQALADWQKSATHALQGHPWANQTSASIIDDLRGGPVEDTLGQP